ncbi:MAG: ABC transporter ATP-binding protein [Alphaproteobacteria bacterium]|uniref:ABC transporter ATP-binding protein n=1 Tax=Candidatus Nitrobium versatile TaxID=2884831 RepID=A0A953LWC3_9BACT|nr:ABC transporter ATP-binding protein [Candidatus Nitrobium versatile]
MPQLVLEGVMKTFIVDNERIDAVNNVSLEVGRGDLLSIIGHSGSGKTTLLSIIGGIVRPTSGRVLFEDRDIYSLASDGLSGYRCEKVGFMFQFASLLPMLTAKENLLLPVIFREGRRSAGEQEERKAAELLRLVGLGDKMNAYPSQLSGGQQRRVAIARAFMNDPELILADEPTGDLDEETEADMMRFFRTMNEERGITFIIVTHTTELARQTKRQMRMSNGVIEDIADSGTPLS